MVDLKKVKILELEKPDHDYILVKCISDKENGYLLTVGQIYQALDGGRNITGEPLFKIITNNGSTEKFIQTSFIRI